MDKQLKRIPIAEFVDELIARIDHAQDIDCCREEIKKLALRAKELIPDETIEVMWKDERPA